MEANKPKSLRQLRKLKKKSTRIHEEWKKTLIIRGNKTSEDVTGFMKDIKSLRKDKAVIYSRKHEIHPFEDSEQIEKYCKANESSLFLFGSHNKKRPNDLVFGRLYENKIMDMVELGLKNYSPLSSTLQSSVPANAHPFLIFQGDVWETEDSFNKLRNLLNDFFYINEKIKGVEVDKIMSVLICFTALEDKRIVMRTYRVEMTGPNILQEDGKMSMQELGPHAEFVVRRNRPADEDTWKKATYVPKPQKKKQDKNATYDSLGNKRGKIYVDRQNLQVMPSKKKLIQKAPKEKTDGLKEKLENQFAS